MALINDTRVESGSDFASLIQFCGSSWQSQADKGLKLSLNEIQVQNMLDSDYYAILLECGLLFVLKSNPDWSHSTLIYVKLSPKPG